ncbi:hypothetical protein Tco_0417051 [Tanacetum coccineum]
MQAEVERERQREEQASMDYIENLYDEVQVRIDVDHELAVRLTHEEHEKYTMVERAKLLAEFCERRKKQLVEERSAAIRNKPLTRTQLRSLMMSYLKHTGRFKHSQLNKRALEEIQALYIKEQERAANFMPIESEEDERLIQKMNNKEAGVHVEKVIEEPDRTKVEVKQEATQQGTRKTHGKVLKMKARKKRNGGLIMKRQSKRKKTDSDLEEEEHLKTILKMVPDEEGIIDFKVLEKRFQHITGNQNSNQIDKHGSRRGIPTHKETTYEMMSLKLIAESASDGAYDLLRFIQKQIDKAGSHDGGEKDL